MRDTTPEPSADPDAVANLLRKRVHGAGLDLTVTGSSMLGVIDSGATVTVVRSDRPRRGQVWVFIDDDGRIIVHRIRGIERDTVTHRGVGNTHDDAPVARSRLVGRVVASRSTSGSRRFGNSDALVASLGFRARGLARRLGLRRKRSRGQS